LPQECDGSAPPTWQLTGSVSGFSTMIDFGDARLKVEQLATTASIGNFASPRWGWTVSAGGILAGQIDHRDLSGGGTVAAQLSWLPVYEKRTRPFVAFTATGGVSYVRATSDDDHMHDWTAVDFRGGVTVGKTFANFVVPYVSARGFGGPVYWWRAGDAVTGSDRYHFTVGAGVILRLPAGFDVSLEAMPLGERSAALGVTRHL
jgi:hypothetical protein